MGRIQSFYLTLIFSFIVGGNVISQQCSGGGCNNQNHQFPSTTFSTSSSSWSTVHTQLNGGNWMLFSVVAGNTYEWSTCNDFGGIQAFDAELTLFNNSNNSILCYQDNSGRSNCPNAPYIGWTATFTGTVKMLISKKSCQDNSGASYATMVWRRSAAASCTTVTLSGNPTDKTVTAPSGTSWTINTTGTSPTYQWEFSTDNGSNWNNVPSNSIYSGTNSATLTLSSTAVSMSNYQFRCKIGGSCTTTFNSNTVTLTVNAASQCATPSVSTSSNSPVISGGSINLSSSPSVNDTYTYNWSGPNSFTSTQSNPTLSNVNTGASGNYCLTITKSGCTPSSQSCTIVTVTAASNCSTPGVTASSNSPLTEGAPLNLTATPASAGTFTYAWSGPNGFTATQQMSSIAITTAATAGRYCVIMTQAGCTPSDQNCTDVIINTASSCVAVNIPVYPSSKSVTAPSGTSFTINANGTAPTYLWEYSTTGGASWNPVPVNAIYSGVSAATLTIASTTTSMDGYLYRCKIGGTCTTSFYSNWLTLGVSSGGCTTPSVTAGSNSPVASGNTLSLTATPAINDTYTYAWTGPGNYAANLQNPSIVNAIVDQSGNYCVTITKAGCTASAQNCTIVNINAAIACTTPSVTGSSNTPVTAGGTLTLSATPVSAGTYSFLWSGPNNFSSVLQNPSLTNTNTSQSGNYCVTMTKAGCTSSAPSCHTVTINAVIPCNTPSVSAGSNSPVNSGSALNLTASPSISGSYTYNWTGPNNYSSSQQNPSISSVTSSMAGSYCVVMTKNGCTPSVADCQTVKVNACLLGVTIGGNTGIGCGETLSLTATPSQSGVSYSWTGPNNFSSTNSSISIANAGQVNKGTYSVTVAKSGCTIGSDSKAVLISECPDITIDNGVYATVIPPWQREGDDFDGKVSVIRTGNVNAAWHLEIDALDGNGNFKGAIIYPSITSSTQNFSYSDPGLHNSAKEGTILSYYAVLDNPKISKNVSGSGVNINNGRTNIIAAKWDGKNVIFRNDGSESLRIPIRYDKSFPADYILISRKGNVSLKISLHAFPPGILNNKNEYQFSVGTDGYVLIDYNKSNLKDVFAGDFEIEVYSSKITIPIEHQSFDLTKYGRGFPDKVRNNKLIVVIGGILNEMEGSIFNLRNNYESAKLKSSNVSFSLLTYLQENGFDIWYIAQGNTNSIRRNGYDIGYGLEEIQKLNPNAEINIVCHSKGGLDLRAYLQGRNDSYDGSGFKLYSSKSNLYNKIKKVLFLGTPHKGAKKANDYSYKILGTLLNAPGEKDLQPNSAIINDLNNNAVPQNIVYANLAGYHSEIKVDASGKPNALPPYFLHSSTDGFVELEENDYFNDLYKSTNIVKQLYQNSTDEESHEEEHTNFYLTQSDSYHKDMNCISKNFPDNLSKILAFFSSVSFNSSNPFESCKRPTMTSLAIGTYKSVLSGARVSFKFKNDSLYFLVGITDENGKLNGTIIPELSYWDSIRIEAAGAETMYMPVSQEFISAGKLDAVLFKDPRGTSLIQYPKISLTGPGPVVNYPLIQLAISAINAKDYYINQHNSDTSFVPFVLDKGTLSVSLDTGYNKILVKFAGTDTVTLRRDVYYYPDSLMDSFAKRLSVRTTQPFKGAKMFVDDIYYRDIDELNTSTYFISAFKPVKFIKNGYRDTTMVADSTSTIVLAMEQKSYSSNTDSTITDFTRGVNPSYWKNITIKNTSISNNVLLSVKQFEDTTLIGYKLVTQSRKFSFRNIGSVNASLKVAVALDQKDTPDPDSVYILSVNNGVFKKIDVNVPSISEYDEEVQKLEYDSLSFGKDQVFEMILMKKLPPILITPTISLFSGRDTILPLRMFVADPDSLHDIVITAFVDNVPMDVSFTIKDSLVYIHSWRGYTGSAIVQISATHDFITSSTKQYIEVKEPPLRPDQLYIYPNPSSDEKVTVEFTLAADYQHTSLRMYDISGRMLKVLINDQPLKKGYHYYELPLGNIGKGTYIFNLNNKTSKQFIRL